MRIVIFVLCVLLIQPVFGQLKPEHWADMGDEAKFAYVVGFREGLNTGMDIVENYLQALFREAWVGVNIDKSPEQIVMLITQFLEEFSQGEYFIHQLMFLLDNFIKERGIWVPGGPGREESDPQMNPKPEPGER